MTCGPTANGQYLHTTTNLLASTSDFTVACWVKLTATTGGGTFWMYIGAPSIASLGYNSSGTPQFSYPGNVDNIAGGNLGTTNWNWFAIVVTNSGANYDIYRAIAGAQPSLVSSAAFTAETVAFTDLYVFQDDTNTLRARGQIYGYKEWQAALTLTELTHECRKTYPSRTTSLNRFCPIFNNATAGQDYSGLGRSLTKTGTLTDSILTPAVLYGGPPSRRIQP